MKRLEALMALALLICLLFVASAAFACGTMPPGQARALNFSVTEFSLPVNMARTSKDNVASQVARILRSGREVQSLVQRLIMQAVTDVLEEQGRRAGLFPTVISGILSQLTVRVSYNALQCDNVLVNPNAQNLPIMVGV
ncbi:hypothetical protein KIN20_013656 [Parelaphostrongylus tenuis]|uniref:Uncharacterized protein n=1 Tax=Parelaphostrongylus tenuis TaxID=148309 RepID=A0AAD5N2B5_PARTN|nr:hypothetical protein KIN20_013656 [Parelaphostrongylus tenuis]